MDNSKITDFLNIGKRELRVFNYLKNNSNSQISSIVRDTKIPRMTLYLDIESLKRRGMIDYTRKGKRKFWSVVPNTKLTSDIVNSVHTITDSDEIRIYTNNSDFAVHKGIEGMYRVWKELEKLSPDSRVLGIQPTNAMKYAFKRLDWQKKIAPLQRNILNKPIIIDGILPDDYYTSLISNYSGNKKMQRKILESFLGRSTDMTFISKEYFKDAESEIIILSNVAFLSDWKNEISIEIRNKALLHFLKELYELVKGYGKKINQEEYIRNLIKGL